ncbi:matrix Gla protein isoform X2 [Etheostoma spectabile]|uniref:matrix Gla protein isoform X2 n=1 Tax=Etheostoma spectabile TaxID=54343 RepID=UPI0013AFBBED|nr:matrix Gla protein isoform X2 [Etheostoma spectabile]XP_032394253.1 matrix Gla protein isoform X2 [Etheostoma spectabile]
MRSLLQCLALCAAVSFCLSYDLFVPPNQANSFISPQRGNVYNPSRGNNHYNFVRKIKSPAERRAETCEDYSPCRFYAFRHGFQQAYQRYFGFQNPPQRPAGTRRY